jgi:hypothetical protein
MDNPNNSNPKNSKTFFFSDFLFLCSIVLVIVGTAYVGVLSYEEGMKTEISKENGEAFANWFTQASAKRMDTDFEVAACGGPNTLMPPPKTEEPQALNPEKALGEGESEVVADKSSAMATQAAAQPSAEAPAENAKSEAPAAAPARTAKTWGGCLKALTTENGPLVKLYNPFTNGPLTFANKCDPSDINLAGAMVFNKISPTPPGSPTPTFLEDLQESDSIEQKLQISVTICDKGSYPIHVADIEF